MRIRTLSVVSLLVGTLFLAGCETADTARDVIRVKGAEASDQLLRDAEWTICKATPIGAIERRFGMTVESAGVYYRFCHGDGEANVIAPQ